MSDWSPQPGMQQFVMNCDVEDIFIGGGRGGGATDVSIAKWMRHRSEIGGNARGLFVRKYWAQLNELVPRMVELYAGAVFSRPNMTFRWDDGSSLRLLPCRAMGNDICKFYGLAASYLAFDGADFWDTSDVVDAVSLAVSTAYACQKQRIITGHPIVGKKREDWLRKRYVDGRKPRVPFEWNDPGSRSGRRTSVFVPVSFSENIAMNDADPQYRERILASCDAKTADALLNGSWEAK